MFSSRAVCLRCRAQSNGVANTVRLSRPSKKFSSISFNSDRGSFSISRFDAFRPSIRSQLPPPSKIAISVPAVFSCASQIRFQSTAQNVGDQVLQSPVTASETVEPARHTAESIASHLEEGGSWEIGFLSDSGLDFGWGPSSIMMFVFEHIHVWGGFSMGISILLLVAAWRIPLFPLSMISGEQSTRLQRIRPKTEPIQARLRQAMVSGDEAEKAKAQREYNNILKVHDIQTWKMFVPMLVQVPFGFASWRVLRNMAYLPAPGMATGGFLWFPNLVHPDPFTLLPLATAGLQYLTFKVGGGGDSAQQSPGLQKFMMFGLPTLTFLFTSWAPAAVQLSFCTSAFIALVTNAILRSDVGRSILGMSPRVRPNNVTASSPYQGVITIDTTAKQRATGAKPAEPEQPRPTTIAQRSKAAFNFRKHIETAYNSVSKAIPGVATNSEDAKKKTLKKKIKQRDDELERKRSKERAEQRRIWEEQDKQRFR